MKLKTFDRTTTTTQPSQRGEATVTLNKNGCFSFSKSTLVILGVKENDRVLLHQDTQNPADFYIQKTTNKNGFVMRNYKSSGGVFSASAVRNEVIKTHCPGKKITSIKFWIGNPFKQNNSELWPLVNAKINYADNPVSKL